MDPQLPRQAECIGGAYVPPRRRLSQRGRATKEMTCLSSFPVQHQPRQGFRAPGKFKIPDLESLNLRFWSPRSLCLKFDQPGNVRSGGESLIPKGEREPRPCDTRFCPRCPVREYCPRWMSSRRRSPSRKGTGRKASFLSSKLTSSCNGELGAPVRYSERIQGQC